MGDGFSYLDPCLSRSLKSGKLFIALAHLTNLKLIRRSNCVEMERILLKSGLLWTIYTGVSVVWSWRRTFSVVQMEANLFSKWATVKLLAATSSAFVLTNRKATPPSLLIILLVVIRWASSAPELVARKLNNIKSSAIFSFHKLEMCATYFSLCTFFA